MGLTPGEIFAGLGSAAGIGISGAFSAASARQQMKFQERMRNTAWQAAVRDMRLAGINPLVAWSQGAAQSPSGASFEVGDIGGAAVSSSMHARRLNADIHMMNQQEKLMKLQGDNVKADTRAKDALGYKTMVDAAVASGGWPSRIAGTRLGPLVSGGAMQAVEQMARIIQGFGDYKRYYPGMPDSREEEESIRTESEVRRIQARRRGLKRVVSDATGVFRGPR